MKTAAFRIFHSWWGFLVPQYATISSYTTEHVGLYLPENKKKANAVLSQDTFVNLTIAQAAEMMKDGTRMDLSDPKDGILIYELIMEHLIAWFTFVQKGSLIQRHVPIEDLRTLANFAERIFPVANRYGYHARLVEKKSEELLDMLQGMYNDKGDKTDSVRYNHKIIASIEAIHRRQTAAKLRS